MKKSTIERFEEKFCPEPNTGCWLWMASSNNSQGYGHFWIKDTMKLAHRVSYEIHKGSIPIGMLVCHECDTPACVNPDHLFLGTDKENRDDMVKKGRKGKDPDNSGENHGLSRLTEKQIIEIRQRYIKGQQYYVNGKRHNLGNSRELAREYGVTPKYIAAIARKSYWKHI